MKVTSGVIDSRFGVRLPGVAVPALLALGIALALLLIPGSVGAGGQGEFIVPIVLEEGRDAPDVVDPASVPVPPQVRTEVEPTSVPPPPQVQTEVEPTSVPPPRVRQVIVPPPPQVRANGVGVRQTTTTPTKLISNTGQAQFGQGAFSNDHAQAFTTGNHSAGYTLTSVTLSMQKFAGAQPTYQATINRNKSGAPDTLVGELSTPSPPQTVGFANRDFTASSGIDLEANTTYWFFINSSSGTTATNASTTTADNEDSGGADGWSIANKRLLRNNSATHWQESTDSLRLAINGYAKPAPALVSAEVNETTLVLTFNHDLYTASRPAARQFGIKFGGGALQRATAISISGRQVTLTVPEVRAGQVVTVSYTVPTSNPLKGANGAEVDAFSDYAVTVKTAPAFGRSETGTVRDAVYVTEDSGVVSEIKAYSADRETLYEYFESECRRLRSVSDPYRDYSVRDADGHLIQAKNGWKQVYVVDGNGNVTRTRAMTIGECAGNKMYQRQAFCNNYTVGQLAPTNKDNVCPDDRSW